MLQYSCRMRSTLEVDRGAKDIMEVLTKALRDGKDDSALGLLRQQAVGVGGSRLQPSTKKLIDTATIEFIKKNKPLLPQYALPDARAGHK